MTGEVRKRYEGALEVLRKIVDRTGVARDRIQALIRRAASEIAGALEEDPDADIDGIIGEFRNAVEAIVMENMREAAREAGGVEDGGVADVALALTFTRVDVSAPVQRYATALSQEVKWFVAGGFSVKAINDYIRDPLGFLAAESTKPLQKGRPARQSAGRMTLAPVFTDGKRRRSLSEVLADFRGSVTAVGSGNSYQVGKSAWMLLNVTSMEAYNDALAAKWTGRGAVGFYVFRASDYDCPICDEQCGWLHPLTGETPPYHPHCVCCMVEAYAGETGADFEM